MEESSNPDDGNVSQVGRVSHSYSKQGDRLTTLTLTGSLLGKANLPLQKDTFQTAWNAQMTLRVKPKSSDFVQDSSG